MIGAQLAGLYSGGAAPANTAYESIATVTVGLIPTTTITFSSIPSTYKHLQLRMTMQHNTADAKVALNSDTTGTNYYFHDLTGNGASAYAGAAQGNYFCDGGTPAQMGAYVMDILDYQNTSKNKTIRTLFGYDNNGSGRVGLASTLWNNTSAVSTLTIYNDTFAQYSSFALYGIKG